MKLAHALSTSAVAALLLTGVAAPSHAVSRDRDRDGIPNRFERTHGMNPLRAADARFDFDRDGLTNLAEYRHGSHLRDEDTDNDGHDDSDEVRDGTAATDVDDADTDDDGIKDGDEDTDRDGTDNEDEDDGHESCARDDDDRDRDNVDDEDENELRLAVGDADHDDDGTVDGDEDTDEDGETNEDEDDLVGDRCNGDRDGDGEADEDEGDLFGTIASFDSGTGALSVTGLAGYTVSAVVDADTEIELEKPEGWEGEFEDEGSTADLVPGAQVVELELDDETGAVEEIEIYVRSGPAM